MKFTALFEESRYIEIEIEAEDLDAAIKKARFMTAYDNQNPPPELDSGTDYDCARIDYTDPETGKDCEADLM